MFRDEHLMKGFDSRKYVRYEIILGRQNIMFVVHNSVVVV